MTCLLTQPLAIWLAGCLQCSQTDQNSICSLAIFFLSEKDQSITGGKANKKKANKDTAERVEALSPFLRCFNHLCHHLHIQYFGLRFNNNLRNVFVWECDHTHRGPNVKP